MRRFYFFNFYVIQNALRAEEKRINSLQAVMKKMGDGNLKEKNSAMNELRLRGEEASSYLLDGLKSSDSDKSATVRYWAAEELLLMNRTEALNFLKERSKNGCGEAKNTLTWNDIK